jgi:hypothetical protein
MIDLEISLFRPTGFCMAKNTLNKLAVQGEVKKAFRIEAGDVERLCT